MSARSRPPVPAARSPTTASAAPPTWPMSMWSRPARRLPAARLSLATCPDVPNAHSVRTCTPAAVAAVLPPPCAPPSGRPSALGTTTVDCNAGDAAGNDAAPTHFDVTVVDTTPPTIDPHADIVGI